MTVPVRVPARVRNWILRETAYLHERRPRAAVRFRGALAGALQQLSEQPRSARPGLIPGTRILARGDYPVCYRLSFESDGVTVRSIDIFAVRHGRQGDAREPK